ncbi:hypothetical protein [Nocardia pneumoniae]|uniref:hypothetical protein n=1 Tax=Nocardia pneumoniae TaxID=228601 RepID=UPI000593214A|nr:hypothetical protein [Nocardia pneumoniae]
MPGAPTDLAPLVNGTQLAEPSTATPRARDVPRETGRSEQTPLAPPASTPRTYAAAPIGTMLPSVDASHSGPADVHVTPVIDAGNVASMAVDGSHSAASTVGGIGAPLAAGLFAGRVVASAAGMGSGVLTPLATGAFVAAVHAAESKRALPSFVVGQQVEEDLVLARTLLATILAAVAGSTRGLEWAVAVGRTPVGAVVVLTSNEGRGWLPPGLFLPSEVVLPWRWDSVLGSAGRKAVAALEGTADPARILAEFGLIVGRRGRVRISALVSSAAVPESLRAALGDNAAVEGRVCAAESAVDLTAPGVGLVDRLTLAGSDGLLREAATVPEANIRAKCLELARAADARVCASVPVIDVEISAHRARRRRILDALQAGLPVPESWWDQIRAADAMTAAALRSRRVDISHLPVGARMEVSGTEALRGMVFERRADELLLLLAGGEPERQTLRDAYYTYGQIVEHPLLPTTARAVAAQTTETTGTATAARDALAARSVGPGSLGSVSVSSIGLGGARRSITELRSGPTDSESSSARRSD